MDASSYASLANASGYYCEPLMTWRKRFRLAIISRRRQHLSSPTASRVAGSIAGLILELPTNELEGCRATDTVDAVVRPTEQMPSLTRPPLSSNPLDLQNVDPAKMRLLSAHIRER